MTFLQLRAWLLGHKCQDSIEEVAVGRKKYFKMPEGFFNSTKEEQSKFIEKVVAPRTLQALHKHQMLSLL